MSFAYKDTIQVTGSSLLLPSTQTNFPLLVSVTDNSLKSTGNGGQVRNASGYDIRPYSDSGLTSALTYQLVSYNATTGTIQLRVLITSLALSTVIYLGIGDVTLTTDGSSTSVWDSNRKGYWTLSDGVSLTLNDLTSNANNLTAVGSPSATAGQVGGGISLDGTTQYVKRNDTTKLDVGTNAYSMGLWVKITSATNTGIIGKGFFESGGNGNGAGIYEESSTIAAQISLSGANHGDQGNATNYVDSVFHKIEFTDTRSGTSGSKLYIDGVLIASADLSTWNATDLTGSNDFRIGGNQDGGSSNFMAGVIDDSYIDIGIARAADWITAAFSNESNGAFLSHSFTSLGTVTGYQTIVRVNQGTGASPSGGAISSAASDTHILIAGNLSAVAFRWDSGSSQTITGVADTAGNTYTPCSQMQDGAGSRLQWFYCSNCLGNAANIITANFDFTTDFVSIDRAQYSGILLTGAFDVEDVSGSATSGTPGAVSGSFSTNQTAELILAAAQVQATGGTWSAGSGYTLITQDAQGVAGIEEMIVTTIQTGITATMNSTSSSSWCIAVATFRAAPASNIGIGFALGYHR